MTRRPAATPRPAKPTKLCGGRLTQLSPEQRQVIEWRNYERLSFAGIGARLGRSDEAARKLWSRAIEQLQALLESPDEPS